MEYTDGENLSEDESLEISVDFLKFKSRFVLDQIKDMIGFNLIDGRGRNLLHWAVESNQYSKVKYLVENELVNLDSRDFDGMNALQIASRRGFGGILDYLQQAGLRCEIRHQNRINPQINIPIQGQIVAAIFADNTDYISGHIKYMQNINGLLSLPQYFQWTLLGVAANMLSANAFHMFVQIGGEIQQETIAGSPLELLFQSLNAVIPPENQQEYVQLNTGIDCVEVCLSVLQDWSLFKNKLVWLENRLRLVGKGISQPEDSYQTDISIKADSLRFKILDIIHN